MKAIDIGDKRELFVDHQLIDRLENARLTLHEPVSGGVAIKIDRPWEGPANFGLSIIPHGHRHHLYYRGWADLEGDPNGVGCVAVSEDGAASWTKPALNLVRRAGWDGNNIVVSEAGQAELSFPFAPWVDSRPGVPDSERIKGITSEPLSGEKHTAMRDPGGPKRMVMWVSADGFRFRRDPSAVRDEGRRSLQLRVRRQAGKSAVTQPQRKNP
jgi:hypothetical protein